VGGVSGGVSFAGVEVIVTSYTFAPARKSAGGLHPFFVRTGGPVTHRVPRGGSGRRRIVQNGLPTETPAIRMLPAPGPCVALPELTAARDNGERAYRTIFILSRCVTDVAMMRSFILPTPSTHLLMSRRSPLWRASRHALYVCNHAIRKETLPGHRGCLEARKGSLLDMRRARTLDGGSGCANIFPPESAGLRQSRVSNCCKTARSMADCVRGQG
jgi:hypothetical protein